MKLNLSDSVKYKIVKAINDGLDISREIYNEGNMRAKNAIHFFKMDVVSNEIIKCFEDEEDFKVFNIKRGSYNVLLLYYIPENSLISIMSRSRLQQLLHRISFENVHYFDALASFNEDNNQISFITEIESVNKNEIESIKDSIYPHIGSKAPISYYTVSIIMKGLQLIGVESLCVSEYMNIINNEDWSDFIELDYNHFEENDVLNSFDETLEISIKPSVARKDDISSNDIKPKIGKKANQA